ncbi:MAG TPA: hypothetical protein PLQ64_14100 [Thiobacillaceae bacterium]|nr:hypothetical protein [Thiobacillaceae bacterium]HNA83601.1 hypothetical protein [Thiobacillaceae bacterium]HNH89354.1 hypothetical protein [Thiobacillaceae bacterium]HNI08390.1 hypothetical protein [Thiobacillaceae bacterium]
MGTIQTHTGAKSPPRDLEGDCPILDCDADLDDYAPSLLETPDGADFIAHYCGLDYLGKWVHPEAED